MNALVWRMAVSFSLYVIGNEVLDRLPSEAHFGRIVLLFSFLTQFIALVVEHKHLSK